jgi:hypothetical protein
MKKDSATQGPVSLQRRGLRLGETIGNRITALASSGFETPLSGSVLAQLIGELVPEQRLVRIALTT